MYKLKKYNDYILYEEIEEVGETEIDDLISNLNKIIINKQEETKKLIDEYFKEYTKDGEEISIDNEYYTYGRYTASDYIETKKPKEMVFVIKLKELTERGYSFDVIKSLTDTELTNIDNKDIEIVSKKDKGPIALEKGFISGKYIVSSEDKIDLLKPKVEEPKDKIDTKVKDDVVKEKPKVEDDIEVKDEETLKKQVNKLKSQIEKITDEAKLSSYLKKSIETKKKIDNQISKLDKLPQNNMIRKAKKVLEIDSSLMGELKSLITKKLS